MMIEIGNTISRQCGVLLPEKWKHCLSGQLVRFGDSNPSFPIRIGRPNH